MLAYRNPILDTDSYKLSHYLQYPPGTTEVSAYIEAREGSRFPEVTFFGLQGWILDKLSCQIYDDHIDEAEKFTAGHIGPNLKFNREGWEIIVDEYNGYLPLEIQAIPEGMTVPVGTPLVQLRNTDARLPWLTTYVETSLLRAIWYPSTVATLSREVKKVIYAGLLKSSDDPDGQIGFKLHDFGARGVSSEESSAIGGAAHLVNFLGSDTISGILYARENYYADMAGLSIPAAEHSTITSWGRDREADAYENMLDQFGTGMVAVVSDSYDIVNAVRNIWGGKLKDKVATMGGVLVVRPDSGDPVRVPVQILQELDRAFGSVRNSKGFKVLRPMVKVIQGDGMNIDSVQTLVRNVLDAGFSIDNIAFGMGGGLLQKVDRDTMNMAMKANEAVIGGDRLPVYKQPATDPHKTSKMGRQLVTKDAGKIISVPEWMSPHAPTNLLELVWRNGSFVRSQDFASVRSYAGLPQQMQKAA
jgi:nicotinamide phosphoribosyltransferase